MKRVFSLVLTLFIIGSLSSVNAQKAKWAEMENFHKVMSQTFHPAEEGHLEPIKSRSTEMVEKASAWKKSSVPEGFDKKAVKQPLKDLVKGAKELDKMIKNNATDAEITAKLTSLHDVFHLIMDKGRAH
jgi:hypothetical protein